MILTPPCPVNQVVTVQAAQANGMLALGLTDHNLLTGVIEFATACKEATIQPIIGLEIHLNDGPVNLLATSLDGWSCLCRLSSAINLRENADTPCTLDMLASYSNGLIAISKQPQLLKDIFPERLYVNIQDPNEAGIESARSKSFFQGNIPS